MTIINALHGRARVRIAFLQRVWLLLLLVVALAVPGLAYLSLFAAYDASRPVAPSAVVAQISELQKAIICLAPLVGALLIERFGIKRAVSFTILVWCGLAATAAAVLDPVTFRVLASLGAELLRGIFLTGLFVTARLAWPARYRWTWLAILLSAYYYLAKPSWLYFRFFPRISADDPSGWASSVFACVTVAAAIFAIWTFGVREVDLFSGLDLRRLRADPATGSWRALSTSKALWTVVVISAFAAIVEVNSHLLLWHRNLPPLQHAPSAVMALASLLWVPMAFLAAAFVSDWFYRQSRTWRTARPPVLVIGFVTAALVALSGAMALKTDQALVVAEAIALGMIQTSNLLIAGFTPRRSSARFAGLAMTIGLVFATYLAPQLHLFASSNDVATTIVVAFAAFGAALSAILLLRLRPALN